MTEMLIIPQSTNATHNTIIPNVKSVILNESFDKIISMTLSDTISLHNIPQEPPIKPLHLKNSKRKAAKRDKQVKISGDAQDKELIEPNKIRLAEKYFKLWRAKTHTRSKENDRIKKITIFLERLKKHQVIKDSISPDDSKDQQNLQKSLTRCPDASQVYKHRDKAQKELIKAQKAKLQEQERVIQNLKMGIVVEETQKCLDNNKYEIRDIFKRCSERVKCTITPPEAVEKDVNVIELRTSKAPKILCEMDERAIQRTIRRNIILEKKRLIEKKKREETEALIAIKKAADEEQRQKNLDVVKERRRIECELERKRQENKKIYLESIKRANRFYKRNIKRKMFNAFRILMEIKAEFEYKSETFHNTCLQKKCLNQWKTFVKMKTEKENFDADCLYGIKLMRKVFKGWRSIVVLNKQSMQVAEDLYDMKLQSKMFIHWHKCICRQQMIEIKNLAVAEKHYNSRILLQHFYLWKSLPAVIQLEKAKEEKKRKWREKVWEILPDYEPCVEVM